MNDISHHAMTVADDGGDQARGLIAAAGALLPAKIPANLAELLFGRTAPEDLLTYSAADLARLAEDAWEFLAERQPGSPKMRVQSPRDGDRLSGISVIEIVNDDKPFLLDSTMDELTELGLEVRLVAHPMLRVARDPAGRAHRACRRGRPRELHPHPCRADRRRGAQGQDPERARRGADRGAARGRRLEADARPRRARSSPT